MRFIRSDSLTKDQVKQAIQEFVFNLNVPTRVGFQCPFSNLTFDLKPPSTLRNQPVIIGGELQDICYGDYQPEMDMFNEAFCEVMLEGDAKGRVFTFPIPTINVTKDLDWESPVTAKFMETACKYGTPYFSNYISSDLSPEDALSMCCRLRLDTKELRKRGGGLFGSNPLTGSIGVVTINLPRLAYQSENETDFVIKLLRAADLASESLEMKRKIIEEQTDHGYLTGEQPVCPICGKETEIWSRVVGYLRPVRDFHQGKKREYADRVKYELPEEAVANRGA